MLDKLACKIGLLKWSFFPNHMFLIRLLNSQPQLYTLIKNAGSSFPSVVQNLLFLKILVSFFFFNVPADSAELISSKGTIDLVIGKSFKYYLQ